MEFRFLCGQKVSLIGLGTGRLASLGAGYTQNQARRCLEAAAEAEINFIDTADSYGSGDCERLLGRLLGEIRHPFLISTKAGFTYCRLPGFFSPLNQVGKKIIQKLGPRQNFQPKAICKNLDHSLKRLRRERVDFFFLHDPTPEALADMVLVETLLGAKKAGKVGHVGISFSSLSGSCIPASHPFASLLQTQVNPWMPLMATGVSEVVANHVFGGDRIFRESARLEEIAALEAITSRQMLVAYAAQQPGVRSVLIGTGRAVHLRENLQGLGKKLSARTVESLSALGGSRHV